MAAQEENSADNQDIAPFEHILSVTWESGTLSAAFYTIQTMETFVVQEVIDLRPNFSLFHNLFRQLNPVYVLASGHESFLQQVVQLLHLPEQSDLSTFDVKKTNFVATGKFYIYPRGEKALQLNRQRILKIKLSGLGDHLTDNQRQLYLDSILPMKQKTVLQSLGNLLDFLDTNLKMLFRFDAAKRNVITDLRVYSMADQLQMDDTTFEALKIFSSNRHPSAFKQEVSTRHREGFSIFTLLNRCSSKIGAVELKTIMQQPTKDVKELNLRYDAVAWFQLLENNSTCAALQRHLKNVADIRTTYKRLLEDPVNLGVWRTLQKSITNAYRVLDVIQSAVAQGENAGLLKGTADAIKERQNLELLIQSLDTILDLKLEDNSSSFIIRKDVDAELDEKKETFSELQNNLPETFVEDIKQFTGDCEQVSYSITFIPEMGYVLAIVMQQFQQNNQNGMGVFQPRDDFTLALSSGNCFYFITPFCRILNEQFGGLFNEIREMEDKIIGNLFKFIESVMVDIQAVVKLCAQVDYLMAFAIVSKQNNYTRPTLSTEKVLNIKNGRHVLLEVQYDFVGNDIEIDQQKLVYLLTAPNSTGKSVFLKQIGSIAYLAHIGCFVPATHATIGVLDAIYSRIYSPEAMHHEMSSFLADVQQMGKLIMNSTDRSLLLVDEFGKGSNVDEGKAILVACLEELIERGSRATPITFLTTHYLDIFDLIDERLRETGTICLTIPTEKREDGSLVSTFRVQPGRCPNRYAFQHSELKKTIQSNGKITNASFCTLNESSSEFMNELTRKKITFAYEVYQEYLKSGKVDLKRIMEMFNDMSLSVDVSSMDSFGPVVAGTSSVSVENSLDELESFTPYSSMEMDLDEFKR